MAAYIIFIREEPVRDQAEIAEYSRKTAKSTAGFNLKPLVLYGALEAVERNAPDGLVVLEFPDIEEARAWYHSPAYQDASQHRMKGADYRVMIVDGFTAPST